MNQNTQPNQITILRDNEPAMEYVRAAQRARIAETLKHTAYNVLSASSRAVGALVTPIALDWQDSLHGTNLRDEWFAKRRDAASAEIRSLIEL